MNISEPAVLAQTPITKQRGNLKVQQNVLGGFLLSSPATSHTCIFMHMEVMFSMEGSLVRNAELCQMILICKC